MYGLLNAASLLLGLGAWGLAAAGIFRRKNYSGRSFFLCSLSLLLQIFYTQYLVAKPDWAAIEDTHGAVTFTAAVLVAVTMVLNAIAAARRKY